MKNCMVLAAVLCVAATMLPAAAQSDAGEVALVHRLHADRADKANFEAAVKKHSGWHAQRNDTWSWLWFEVITGKDAGVYIAGTFNHDWKDWDMHADAKKADAEHVQQTIAQHIESASNAYYVRMANISRPGDIAKLSPLYELFHYDVRFGKVETFMHVIGKFHKAIGEADLPWEYNFYALANGGEHPTFVLSIRHEDFDSMKTPEKNLRQVCLDVYGETETNALFEQWYDAIESIRSEMIRFRPDLSYQAETN